MVLDVDLVRAEYLELHVQDQDRVESLIYDTCYCSRKLREKEGDDSSHFSGILVSWDSTSTGIYDFPLLRLKCYQGIEHLASGTRGCILCGTDTKTSLLCIQELVTQDPCNLTTPPPTYVENDGE
ncbi:hypothetical protein H2248_006629 [Termitomyces sp. 'cryptogamus']|nr:hypothetical protein H2248_006629 [Termitomyces sp. 'cryptogamus']